MASRGAARRRSAKSAKASSANATSDDAALPGDRTSSSASTGRWTTSTATSRRLSQHLELVALSVAARLRDRLRPGPARAPPALAAAAAAGGHRRPLHDPQHRLLLAAAADHRPRPRHRDHRPQRLHPADHLPQHVAGLANVPGAAKDAARGMGMTDRQLLWRVELPLAMPEIIAGLRIATVSTVAIATLAVFAGGGGLGEPDLREAEPHLQDQHHHRRRDRDPAGDRLRR